MNIEKDIANWDGKSSSDIEAIYKCYCDDESFVSNLLDLSQNTELQKGTSWLMKRYLEDNHRLGKNEIASLFKLLSKLQHWETRMHILQCIPYMPIGRSERKWLKLFYGGVLRTTINL